VAGLVLFLVPACLLLALIFGRPVAAGLAAAGVMGAAFLGPGVTLVALASVLAGAVLAQPFLRFPLGLGRTAALYHCSSALSQLR
jgi:hypothetical protein